MRRQFDVLRDNFPSNTGFRFEFKELRYIDNDTWFRNCHLLQYAGEIKDALVKQPETSLNVIVCGPTANILGYATFPSDHPETSKQHAVVINYQTMPGVALPPSSGYEAFALGITLVHETGHWLGLAHTFNSNSCGSDNDEIDDTPIERSPAAGCPVNPARDSCPSQPGVDPVRNFMDYSDDACMTDGFTPMQIDLMREQTVEFRPSLLSSSGNGGGGDSNPPAVFTCTDSFAKWRVEIVTDNYPQETSWVLQDVSKGTIIASGQTAGNSRGSRVEWDLDICVGEYAFEIRDSYGDGICCNNGNGIFRVFVNDNIVGSGGEFTTSERVAFSIRQRDLRPIAGGPGTSDPPVSSPPPPSRNPLLLSPLPESP